MAGTTEINSPAVGCGVPDGDARRAYREQLAEPWPAFELDRRRIIASSAFRRLQYKTQVFVAPGDHFRTRLTHTLEVAGVARRLALGLRLNATLAEAVALAHDLGHPPFGHAGERALNELMSAAGGFEHNAQSLRVVEYLEHPFPSFRGLNLTREVREGLARHRTAYDNPENIVSCEPALNAQLTATPSGTLEGQVADIADRIAYDCHDLEDGIGAGILNMSDLDDLALWQRYATPVVLAHPGASLFAVWRPAIECIQHGLITDVMREVGQALGRLGISSTAGVRAATTSVVAFSSDMRHDVEALETFLHERLYAHPTLRASDCAAADKVSTLFRAYSKYPERLPERFTARIAEQGVERVVCDYIAGMTDRFCAAEYSECGSKPS